MKRNELQKCCLCKKGIMHAGIPLFYVVKVQRFGIDAKAVQRIHGLENFFGGGGNGAVLANIMGDDPDIAKPMDEEKTLFVCEMCSMEEASVAWVAGQEEQKV